MDSWDFRDTSWKDSKPLGESLSKFVMENAQWVIYLRKDPRFPCVDCWDQATQTPKLNRIDCHEGCWGTGLKTTLQLVPIRIIAGSPNNLLEGDLRLIPGFLERNQVMGIFPRIVYPKLEDLVLVAEWKEPTQTLGLPPKKRPLKITDVYAVKSLSPHFEREYGWTTSALEVFSIDFRVLNAQLPTLGDIEVLRPPVDNKSYW